MRKATLLILLLFSATHAQTYESGRWALPSAQAARAKLTDTAVAYTGWLTRANLCYLRAQTSPSPFPPPTPTPTPTPIPCVLLPDDFNDNSRDAAKWNLGVLSTPAADPLVTVLEQNQHLEIQPRANSAGNHYNGYVSALTWNLTNTHTSVEVVFAPTNGSDTIFAIGNDNHNYYRFVVSGELLYFQERFGGVLTQASIAFDASNHRSWRLRHDPGTDQVIFETSPDGVTNWNDRWAVKRHFALTAVRVELSGGSAQSLAAPDKSIFDNLVQNNECPTPTPTPLPTAAPTPTRVPTPRGPTINVKDFGARGNGQADDTAPIRSALAVSIARTRPLYLPTGTYLIDARDGSEFGIRIDGAVNVKFIGDGMGKTVIRYLQRTPLVNEILNPIVLRHGASATFEDLEIVGPTPRTANSDGGGAWASPMRVTYGILDFAGATPSRLTMNRVKISGVTHGVKVDFTDGKSPVTVIQDGVDISAGSQGILMTNSGKLTIRNSTFHDTGSTSGPNVGRDHHVYCYAGVQVDIQNSTFRDNGGFVLQQLQDFPEWTPQNNPRPPFAIDIFKNNKIGPNQGRGLLTNFAHRMYAEGNDFNTVDANISVYGDLDVVNNTFAGGGPGLLDYSGINGTKVIRAKGNVFNNPTQPIQKISTNLNVADWILHLGDNKFAAVPDMIFFSTAPVDRINELRFYSGNVWAGTGRIYSVNGKVFGKDADIPAARRGPGNFVNVDLGQLTIPTP